MKPFLYSGTMALAVASALAIGGCASPDYYDSSAMYGTPVTLLSTAPAREVVVERAPAREVIVERAPAREVVIERAPAREVVVERAPAREVVVERYVERVPADVGPGGRAVAHDGSVVAYDREIILRPTTTAVTVRRDEVVRFVAADTGRSFVWRFNTPQENVSFPLATIAPSTIPTSPAVMVHVSAR
jgi:heavy-metal resistance protein CzcE